MTQPEIPEQWWPWQRDLMERIARGEQVTMNAPYRSGRSALTLLACAAAEAACQNWEIVSSDPDAARTTRRRAREIAADLTNPSGDAGHNAPPEGGAS